MPGATLTTIDKALKEDYLPPIRDQFNTKKVLLAKIQRGRKQDVVGKTFVLPIVTARPQGTAPRGESQALPTAGSVTYDTMATAMRYNYSVVRVTGQAIEAAKSDKGSFIRSLDGEIKGAAESMLRSINRQLNMEGSGILAICGTTSSSTTVVVYDARYLEVGMTIDVLTIASGAVNVSARTISSVNKTANTFVISGAAISTTDKTHGIYYDGGADGECRNIDMMGILGLIEDSNPSAILDTTGNDTGRAVLQTLDVATDTFWVSTVLSNSGTNRPFTQELMDDLFAQMEEDGGRADEVDMLYSHIAQWKRYGRLLRNDRRYGANAADTKQDGGFRYLEYDGVPWYYDRDAPKNRVYAVDSSDLAIYQMSELKWQSREGSILKWVDSYDAYTAFLSWYAELGIGRRFKHGVLTDLTQ